MWTKNQNQLEDFDIISDKQNKIKTLANIRLYNFCNSLGKFYINKIRRDTGCVLKLCDPKINI